MSEQKKPGTALALGGLSQTEILETLKSSLYPGAKDASVNLVLNYCKAAGLDVMKKPVHIVPMSVSTGQKNDKGWDVKEQRDVVMPGIGLYRTEASRTGQYVGLSEPEFGPMLTLEWEEEVWGEDERGKRVKSIKPASMQYPEWCRIVIKRKIDGEVCEFVAKEYWIENYATKGKGDAPNEMWRKRSRGQLAKCTEAQALRKGFPDTTGAQPTAEEMEGREQHMGPVEEVRKDGDVEKKKDALPTWPDERCDAWIKANGGRIKAGEKADDAIAAISTKWTLTKAQEDRIRALEVTDVVDKTATAAEKADQATGEIPAPADATAAAADAPKVTYAVLADRVVKATDTDELDAVMDLAQALPKDQRAELFDIIDRRRDELLAPG